MLTFLLQKGWLIEFFANNKHIFIAFNTCRCFLDFKKSLSYIKLCIVPQAAKSINVGYNWLLFDYMWFSKTVLVNLHLKGLYCEQIKQGHK